MLLCHNKIQRTFKIYSCQATTVFIPWTYSVGSSKKTRRGFCRLLTHIPEIKPQLKTSEAMISLWENREKWEKDSNLHALLLTIIKNKSLNYLEHEQVRMRAEEAINTHKQRELDLRIATLEACEPESIFNTEIQRIVYKTLEQLPEQSRHIFILSRYHNAPNKKIAEQLGISIKSVEFHITKALKLLRLELKDYLISLLF